MNMNADLVYTDLVAQLEPLVLRLPDKEDQKRIASWVRKLNEPNLHDKRWKVTRNQHAQLLRTMLERGKIGDPFLVPPPTTVEPLPSSVTMFLDTPTPSTSDKRKLLHTPKKAASLPDLSLTSEEEVFSGRGEPGRFPRPAYSSTPGRPLLQNAGTLESGLVMPSHGTLMAGETETTTAGPPNYKGIIEKELQMKERLLSNRYSEERMKIQRYHDELLQKILDKKTKEVEEFRSEYRGKVLQLENQNKSLERRIQQLLDDNARLKEQKERQAFDFRNAQAQTAANMKREWESRLARQREEGEAERAREREGQQGALQHLIDETTATMTKMEEEYKQQTESMNQFLKESEERNAELKASLETLGEERRKETEAREVLAAEVDGLKEQLEFAETRLKQAVEDADAAQRKHTEEVEGQQLRFETALQNQKVELQGRVTEAQTSTKEREAELKGAKVKLEEERLRIQDQIWESESRAKAELARAERQHEKRMRAAEKLADKKLNDADKELELLRGKLRAREEEVAALYEAQKRENKKSEEAFAELKTEMQANTDRMYREIQAQVATDRERAEDEFRQREAEEKRNSEQRVAEAQVALEKEKERMIEVHHAEISEITAQHNQEKMELETGFEKERSEAKASLQLKLDEVTKVTCDLEGKLEAMGEELSEARETHRRLLQEAHGQWEKERKQSLTANQKLVAGHKQEIERLKKQQGAELEKLTAKTSHKMKLLEEDFNERYKQTSLALEKAWTANGAQSEEFQRQAVQYESSVKKLQQEVELARADEAHRHRNITQALEQEVETQRGLIQHLERKNQVLALEMEERITRTKLLYEEKIKGSVSASVREELEETIAALKTQSTILEQKATILQSELEARSKKRATPSKARGVHSSPLKVKG